MPTDASGRVGITSRTSAASKQPNTDIWKGRFLPVMSRYLSNTAISGYSTTAWYTAKFSAAGLIPFTRNCVCTLPPVNSWGTLKFS
jgi:hypothetical protein